MQELVYRVYCANISNNFVISILNYILYKRIHDKFIMQESVIISPEGSKKNDIYVILDDRLWNRNMYSGCVYICVSMVVNWII